MPKITDFPGAELYRSPARGTTLEILRRISRYFDLKGGEAKTPISNIFPDSPMNMRGNNILHDGRPQYSNKAVYKDENPNGNMSRVKDKTATRSGYTTSTDHVIWRDNQKNTRVMLDELNFVIYTECLKRHPGWPHTSVALNYTALSSDMFIYVDASTGGKTITLPPASDSDGCPYIIKKTDSSANAVTVDGDGSETIDGATTYSLPNQWDFVGVHSDGSQWLVFSK